MIALIKSSTGNPNLVKSILEKSEVVKTEIEKEDIKPVVSTSSKPVILTPVKPVVNPVISISSVPQKKGRTRRNKKRGLQKNEFLKFKEFKALFGQLGTKRRYTQSEIDVYFSKALQFPALLTEIPKTAVKISQVKKSERLAKVAERATL